MKKKVCIGLICLVLFLFTGCGKIDSNNGNQIKTKIQMDQMI